MTVDVFLDLCEDNHYKCQCGELYEKFQIESKVIQLLKDFLAKENKPNHYCQNCRSIKEDFYF